MTHQRFIIPTDINRQYYQLSGRLGCTRDHLIHDALTEAANRLESQLSQGLRPRVSEMSGATSLKDGLFSLPARVHVRFAGIAQSLGCSVYDLVHFCLLEGAERIGRQLAVATAPSRACEPIQGQLL